MECCKNTIPPQKYKYCLNSDNVPLVARYWQYDCCILLWFTSFLTRRWVKRCSSSHSKEAIFNYTIEWNMISFNLFQKLQTKPCWDTFIHSVYVTGAGKDHIITVGCWFPDAFSHTLLVERKVNMWLRVLGKSDSRGIEWE